MKARLGYLLLASALLAAAFTGWWRWGEALFVAGVGGLC